MFFSAVSFGADYVTVSIMPLKYLVEKIAGDTATVNVLVPEGSNPHIYEPKPKEMINYSKSVIYFSPGDDFDRVWLDKFLSLNKNIKVVYLDKAIEKIDFETGHKDENEDLRHGKTDPHIWTSLSNIRIIAETVKNSLKDVFPKNSLIYENNFKRFSDELEDLDKKIRGTIKGGNFLVFHPSWGYFARDYGIKQIAIESEGREPSAREIKKIIDLVKEGGIKYIFTQPQINSKSVEVIAKQTGLKIVTVDPLAYNILDEIKKIYEVISR